MWLLNLIIIYSIGLLICLVGLGIPSYLSVRKFDKTHKKGS